MLPHNVRLKPLFQKTTLCANENIDKKCEYESDLDLIEQNQKVQQTNAKEYLLSCMLVALDGIQLLISALNKEAS